MPYENLPLRALDGGDKQATQKPTAVLRMTKVAAGMVRTVGGQRPLAPPCRRSNRNTSWRCVSLPPTAPCPRGAYETLRGIAGAHSPLADSGRGADRERPWRGGGAAALRQTFTGTGGLTRLHIERLTSRG
jgi:hypothetical protein